MSHPNTLAAGLSGLAGTGLVYVLNHWAGTSLTASEGGIIAAAAASAVLYVGRRGIKPTLASLWSGKPPPK